MWPNIHALGDSSAKVSLKNEKQEKWENHLTNDTSDYNFIQNENMEMVDTLYCDVYSVVMLLHFLTFAWNKKLIYLHMNENQENMVLLKP